MPIKTLDVLTYKEIMDALRNAGYNIKQFATLDELIPAAKEVGYVYYEPTQSFVKSEILTQLATEGATTGTTSTALATAGVKTVTDSAGTITGYELTSAGAQTIVDGAIVSEEAIAPIITPKSAVICAAAAALGLEIGFAIDEVVDKLFFDDQYFDWSKFATFGLDGVVGYLSEDGETTYYDEELLEAIKNHLLEIGAFDSDELNPPTDLVVDTANYQTVPKIDYNTVFASLPNIVEIVKVSDSIDLFGETTTLTEPTDYPIIFKDLYQIALDNLSSFSYFNKIPKEHLKDCLWSYALCSEAYYSGSDYKRYIYIDISCSFLSDRMYTPIFPQEFIDNNFKILSVNNEISEFNKYPNDYNFRSDSMFTFDKNYNSNIEYTIIPYSTVVISMTGKKIGNDWRNVEKLRIYKSNSYSSYNNIGRYGYLSVNRSYLLKGFIFNNLGSVVKGGITDVNKQSGATLPTTDSIATTYPDWNANRKERLTADPDKKVGIIPLTVPDVGKNPNQKPDNNSQDKAQEGQATQEQAKEQLKSQDDIAQQTDIPINPSNITPENDIGSTPVIIGGYDKPLGLVHIYNPTQSELAQFSQYLWSDSFLDYITKILNNPMDAIIGLHQIYATPVPNGTANIIVGRNDSNVSSSTVNQYINIDCGSVTVNKYFDNALDYINTKIEMYLPFIGIVTLKTEDCMNKTLNVKYNIDVLTGTCLASIIINNQCLYQYGGNCSIQLPITGSNYSTVMGALTTVAGGIAGYALGGPVGGAVGGAVLGAGKGFMSGNQSSTQVSGQLGSNAGAMGIKKPYLIITRNRNYEPVNYQKYYGYPSNSAVALSSLKGYTKVKDIHLHIKTTDSELAMIEARLKEGVIL